MSYHFHGETELGLFIKNSHKLFIHRRYGKTLGSSLFLVPKYNTTFVLRISALLGATFALFYDQLSSSPMLRGTHNLANGSDDLAGI